MKTREEILALWIDQEKCPDFEPILKELLDDRDRLLKAYEEEHRRCDHQVTLKFSKPEHPGITFHRCYSCGREVV